MSFTDLREKYAGFYTPRFAVTVGDRTYDASSGLVSEVSVDTTIDGADTFSFTLDGRFDRASGEFVDIDWDRVAAGERVTLGLGYGSTIEPLVVGRIGSVTPSFPADGAPSVGVNGFGLLHDLMEGTTDRSWDDTTDSAVVEEVAGAYAFADLDVQDTGLERPKVVQHGQNDYRFLRTLADRNGYELFATGETFRFREPDDDRTPSLTLRYGESLTSFSPEVSTEGQVSAVEVRHWDAAKKQAIVGTAESEDDAGPAASVAGSGRGAQGPDQGTRVIRVPVRSEEEAEAVAEAALARIEAGLVTGSGETVGLPEVRAGETLGLTGLGERFSRPADGETYYYVESVRHRLGAGGFTTSFEVTETIL